MKAAHRGPLISAGILFGTGIGGFIDGIAFHQILQWHNMLSSVRAPIDLVAMKYNMVWDGLFHAFTWTMVCLGLWRLWAAGKRADVPWSTRTLLGSLALGWGLFNVIEGVLDHQLLGIHHVHPGQGQLAGDLAFLAFGIVAMVVGWMAVRAGRTDVTPRGGLAFDPAPIARLGSKAVAQARRFRQAGAPPATRAPRGRCFRAPACTRRGERRRPRVPA
jgi:uncharacterized membrane protein